MRSGRAPIAACIAATLALSAPHANADHAAAFGFCGGIDDLDRVHANADALVGEQRLRGLPQDERGVLVRGNGAASTQIVIGTSMGGAKGTVTVWSASAVENDAACTATGRSAPNAIDFARSLARADVHAVGRHRESRVRLERRAGAVAHEHAVRRGLARHELERRGARRKAHGDGIRTVALGDVPGRRHLGLERRAGRVAVIRVGALVPQPVQARGAGRAGAAHDVGQRDEEHLARLQRIAAVVGIGQRLGGDRGALGLRRREKMGVAVLRRDVEAADGTRGLVPAPGRGHTLNDWPVRDQPGDTAVVERVDVRCAIADEVMIECRRCATRPS